MTNAHFTAASLIHCLLDVLAEDGHDTQALASQQGIDLAQLHTPQATIGVPQLEPLWRLIYERHGALSGIKVGQGIKLLDFQDLGIYLAASENVSDWIQQLRRYVHLIGDIVDLRLELKNTELAIEIRYKSTVALMHERLEFTAIIGNTMINQYLDKPLQWSGIELTRPQPVDPGPWYEAFGTEIKWGAPVTKYLLGHTQAQRPLLTRDAQLRKVLGSLLNARLRQRKSNDPLNQVKVEMSQQLSQSLTLDSVASALNTSKRSLQRILQKEQTSFSELLSEVRREMAESYLSADVPVQEVCVLLGYAEQSVFQRAFKQWTGLTPSEFVTARKNDTTAV